MAAVTTGPSSKSQSKHNASRRRKLIGQRRRVGDEEGGEDDGANNAVDLVDDDSLTEGSTVSEEHNAANDSDTSNVDEASPTVPAAHKEPAGQTNDQSNSIAAVNTETARPANATETSSGGAEKATTPVEQPTTVTTQSQPPTSAPVVKQPQPPVVSSSSAQPQRRETAYERQRREHDLYKQRRDEDPSFVPNRGAFFMHDHRGAGPAANGFRPFGRPGRGGRGRGGFGGPFSPMQYVFFLNCSLGVAGGTFTGVGHLFCLWLANRLLLPSSHFQSQPDPTVNGPWAHDMHEMVAQPVPPRLSVPGRRNYETGSQYGGSQVAASTPTYPTCPPSATPINRSMSVEKQLGTVTLRIFFPPMKEPMNFEKFKVMQYTKLPDHRPPLRRDKAVVIDLPGHPKRQIFPAVDRSFIFIPRAMRPNQQRSRGNRARSCIGSISGFSRRTSAFDGSYYNGSYYNGSMYSPSIAMSRRSSIAQDVGRDFISPAGSTISRPPLPMENVTRPVVRLPPSVAPPIIQAAAVFPMTVPMAALHAGPVPYPMPLPHYQPPPFGPSTNATVPAPNISFNQRPQQGPNSTFTAPTSQPLQPLQPNQGGDASSLSTVPLPQNYPLPQKPPFRESRPSHNLPMHQPRPQKTVLVENIEAPKATGTVQPPAVQTYSMPFHQQVPVQVAANHHPAETHSRQPSYQSHTTGTPLSQIPERAIHAAPFQPNQPSQPLAYPQPVVNSPAGSYYSPSGVPVLQPPPRDGAYFYQSPHAPEVYSGGTPESPAPGYVHPSQSSANGQHNMVAQEVNGMVYYIDASQMPGMPGYPNYAPVHGHGGYMPGAGGMVPQVPAQGYMYAPQPMVYYQQ